LAWCVIVIVGTAAGLSAPIASSFVSLALHPMTLEFIFGAGTGLLVASSIHWRPGILTVLATVWLAAAICLHGVATENTLLWTRVLWFGLPSAILVYAVASLDIQKRVVWLVPAGVSLLVTLLVFQAYGIGISDPLGARLSALTVALTVGTLAALITLWAGWIGGRQAPDALFKLSAPLNTLFNQLAALGEWSYSLYLVHIMVLTALRVVFERFGRIEPLAPVFRVGHDGRLDNIVFAITCVVLSIAAAANLAVPV
jgi:peptidoglycan/LPS O-acetylase OafA/YrhL